MVADNDVPQAQLSDLMPPGTPPGPVSFTSPRLTPEQIISFASPDDWETFIREWATGLDRGYAQIKRFGGPGDRGVDVAAFVTDQEFEGEWDCFQGKHYANALAWSDAFPEMLKILKGVIAGHYSLPRRYAFLSPRGCSMTLNQLLSTPTVLRAKFLEELGSSSGAAGSLDEATKTQVRTLAESTDFSLFQSVEVADAIAVHRTTAYHVQRFGGPLPERPNFSAPPDGIAENEAPYIAQLIRVYRERDPNGNYAPASIHRHTEVGEHFQRQRITFYAAESLRLYARDAVPTGTFEALQEDIHSGVVEVAEAAHPSGMDRLTAVLQESTRIDLSAHALISVSRIDDRKGICHQLANDGRLDWVRVAS